MSAACVPAAAAAALSRGWALGGRYDAIFSLADSFLGQVREFFGLGGAFPCDQLVARSATGKSVIFLAPALLALLRSDVQTKLKLVNTGVRLLEKCDDPLM